MRLVEKAALLDFIRADIEINIIGPTVSSLLFFYNNTRVSSFSNTFVDALFGVQLIKEIILAVYGRVFARTRFLKWNNFLFDLALRGLGIMNHSGFRISGEKFLIDYLRKNISLKTIFDVGANTGQYASLCEGFCEVYSFEPNPHSFQVLSDRFKHKDHLRTYNFGFSDSGKSVNIYDQLGSKGSDLASIYKEVITDIHNEETEEIQVELKTIDGFIEENGIETISLLKIDTEGNELSILKGALKSTRRFQIDIIQIEFNEMNVISRTFLKDFIDLLPNYNFYRLLPKGFLPIDYKKLRPLRCEIFAFQNVIAFRKDLDPN